MPFAPERYQSEKKRYQEMCPSRLRMKAKTKTQNPDYVRAPGMQKSFDINTGGISK